MSCLTTISRLDGWHLTTDGEPSLISFELRGLENKNKLYSLILRQGKYKKSHNEVYSVQYVIKWHNTLQSLYHDRNLDAYHMNHCRYIWFEITDYHTFITAHEARLKWNNKEYYITIHRSAFLHKLSSQMKVAIFFVLKDWLAIFNFCLISPVIKRHSNKTIPTVTLCTSRRKVRNDTQLND